MPVRNPWPHGWSETLVGCILLAWSLVAAVIVSLVPSPNQLDLWGFTALPAEFHDRALLDVAELRALPVLLAGSVLAALCVVGRDRWRAVACLLGPAMAVVLVEWFAKPIVGRRYGGVLDFPSGSVTVVASLATAWVLAVPRQVRWVVTAIGAVAVTLMSVAVIRLRWHYPTDALAAAMFGAGVVLALDGALQVVRTGSWRPERSGMGATRPPPSRP